MFKLQITVMEAQIAALSKLATRLGPAYGVRLQVYFRPIFKFILFSKQRHIFLKFLCIKENKK
jgi:hypothetical protein